MPRTYTACQYQGRSQITAAHSPERITLSKPQSKLHRRNVPRAISRPPDLGATARSPIQRPCFAYPRTKSTAQSPEFSDCGNGALQVWHRSRTCTRCWSCMSAESFLETWPVFWPKIIQGQDAVQGACCLHAAGIDRRIWLNGHDKHMTDARAGQQ